MASVKSASVKSRVRAGGRRLVQSVAPTVMHSVSEIPRLRERIERLENQRGGRRFDELMRQMEATRRRVDELQEELQEARRLQQRVAELTDVVAEVLIPAADRDDERMQRALAEFARTSF